MSRERGGLIQVICSLGCVKPDAFRDEHADFPSRKFAHRFDDLLQRVERRAHVGFFERIGRAEYARRSAGHRHAARSAAGRSLSAYARIAHRWHAHSREASIGSRVVGKIKRPEPVNRPVQQALVGCELLQHARASAGRKYQYKVAGWHLAVDEIFEHLSGPVNVFVLDMQRINYESNHALQFSGADRARQRAGLRSSFAHATRIGLFISEITYLLTFVVVKQFEVLALEAGDRLIVLIGNKHVDLHKLRPELYLALILLLVLRRSAQRRSGSHQRNQQPREPVL